MKVRESRPRDVEKWVDGKHINNIKITRPKHNSLPQLRATVITSLSSVTVCIEELLFRGALWRVRILKAVTFLKSHTRERAA